MIHCNVCHGWRPSQWNGWKWDDTEAPCIYVTGHPMSAEGWCERASITKPGVLNVKPVSSITASHTARTTVQQTTAHHHDNDLGVDNNIIDGDDLFTHQQEAIIRYDKAKEIALFWEMGVAKSATVLFIAAAKFRRQEIDALLIVAPNDVHVQWYREQLPMWLRVPYDAQCFGGRGGAKQTYPFDNDPEMLQVVCVNIDTFSTPAKWKDIVDWANYKKTMIILDEATVIKNVNAQRTQRMLYAFNDTLRKGKTITASRVKSVARAVLTGTPVTNGPMDLWAIMEFLRPNFFGRNWYSFQNHYGMFTKIDVNGRVIQIPLNEERWAAIKAINNYNEAAAIFGCSEDTFNTVHAQDKYEGPYKHAEELRQMIQPVASFKLLRDCVDMPEQNYDVHTMQMSTEQRTCYDSMVAEFVAEYNDHKATALNKMTAMIRLQQISSGFICDKDFGLVEPEETGIPYHINLMYSLAEDTDIMPNEIQWIGNSNPKLDMLYRDVDESAKPVIIITRFSAEAARIYDDLQSKYSTCLMTGWKRVGTIEEFKAGKYDIMVANITVISKGFNLQNSHTMLFYSNTFSLEARLQGEGRVFRIGQKEPCLYVDYTYEDSVDEKIIAALKLKRNLLDFIRSADMKEVVT